MDEGRSGLLFRTAKFAVTAGLSTRLHGALAPGASTTWPASCTSLGALAFRFAWVEGGKASAAEHADVAAMGRGATHSRIRPRCCAARGWSPRRAGPGRLGGLTRIWSELVRRISLAVERLLPF